MTVIVQSADPADAELCVRAVLLLAELAGHGPYGHVDVIVRPIIQQGALW